MEGGRVRKGSEEKEQEKESEERERDKEAVCEGRTDVCEN